MKTDILAISFHIFSIFYEEVNQETKLAMQSQKNEVTPVKMVLISFACDPIVSEKIASDAVTSKY